MATSLHTYEKVLKAAADRTRVRILKMLEEGELRVSEVMEVLGAGQSTVSGHLAILKDAGLVRDRRQGRSGYYSLADRKDNPYSLPLLAMILGWLDDDQQVRADKRRLAAMLKSRNKTAGLPDGRG